MQYWFKAWLLSLVCVCLCWGGSWSGPCLFDGVCVRTCCCHPFLWRKLVSPFALQSHLEFICKPDPDSCLFFLSGERKKNREMAGWGWGGWLMSVKVIDIREDRTRMEVRLGEKPGKSGAGLFPFSHLWIQWCLACWAFETQRTISGALNDFH